MADELPADSRATLFVSYARADVSRADRLISALQKHGYKVWWDAKLEGGSAFADSIADVLQRSDVVIVLWSKASVSSDWVRDEASVGRDRKRLVPLSLDGTEPPLGFRQYHVINLSQWKGRADGPELRAVDRAIDLIRGNPLEQDQPPGRTSRRTVLIAGSGVAVLVAGVGATVAWQEGLFGQTAESDNSIAVLPFKNLGGDPAHAYLAEGITEEVRAALKRISALKVLASTSSALAAEEGGGAKAISRRLGVAYLLEGSVQRGGDLLRIGVDLTEGRTGFNNWTKQFEGPLADIFSMQREIAIAVASAMAARMATAKPEVGGTTSVAAYEFFLRGREKYFNSTGEPDDRAALALFDLAVASDPKFARAHAMRARSLVWLAATSASPSEKPSFLHDALQTAQQAVELAPASVETQMALGSVRARRLDLRESKPVMERAVALAPNDAEVLRNYASVIATLGEFDAARKAATKAISLDPLNHLTYGTLGEVEFLAQRYRAAIGHIEKSLLLNPSSAFGHAQLAFCLLFLGKPREALTAANKETAPFMQRAALAIVYRKLGDDVAATKSYQALLTEGDLVTYQQAQVLSQWGQKDAALRALERAVRVRDLGLVWLRVDPLLEPLRSDTRYNAMLRQMRFV